MPSPIVNFSASSASRTVYGSLLVSEKNNIFQLMDAIGGQDKIILDTKKIADIGNFIASIIRRLDTKEEFDSIVLLDNNKKVPILRKSDNEALATQRFYVKDGKNNEDTRIVTDQGFLNFEDIDGNLHQVEITTLGFEAVDVPIDFQYTKNPLLNAIYKKALVPHNYDRSMNAAIMKAISKHKKAANGERWGFWCSRKSIQAERWHGRQYGAVLVTSEIVEAIESELSL